MHIILYIILYIIMHIIMHIILYIILHIILGCIYIGNINNPTGVAFLSHDTLHHYIHIITSSSSSSWTQFLEMSSISHICLSPPIFLFVFLFIFHICRLTCPIFFSQFPTSNWSPCAAICIVIVQLFSQNIPSKNILQNILRIGSNALQ